MRSAIDFIRKLRHRRNEDVITIVSGLPRSGTSMMMQMLEAGGMPVVTDNIRRPDEDNPRGYYEFEKVKKIKEDVSWLDSCQGRAFKMVTALLYHLPPDKKYKVIFMRREMKEILASQKAMLIRSEKPENALSDQEMAERFEEHLHRVEAWLAKQSNIEVIYMKYNEVIRHPYENARVVARLLEDRLDVEKMARVVERSLYRQKKE